MLQGLIETRKVSFQAASWKPVSILAADYRDDGDELIYGVLLDANTGEALEAKWNREDVKNWAEYQYSPSLIRNVAGQEDGHPRKTGRSIEPQEANHMCG